MKRSISRIFAASISALALVGVGMSGASAADTVSDPNFVQTFHLADAETAEAVTGTIGFNQQVVGLLDLADYEVKYPIPADATGGWVFIAPQGQESNPAAWNAMSNLALTPGGIMLPNVSLSNQTVIGSGSPAGVSGLVSSGGDYSVGIAYTKSNGVILIPNSLYYGHMHIIAGSGDWTYTEVEAQKAASTTTVTAPTTVPENTSFTVSAEVAPAGATGSVHFFDGVTDLGSAPVSGGVASLTVAAGLIAGTHSITASYSGNSAYAQSVSAAAAMTVTGTPVNTTTSVVATSVSGIGNQAVVYTATVVAGNSTTPTGDVAFTATKAGLATPVSLGSAPVQAGGLATLTNTALPAGDWTITAAFTGTGVYQTSNGTANLLLNAPANPATPDEQTVIVAVPEGGLTITTPWTAAHPLDMGSMVLNQATSTYELAAPVEFASDTNQSYGIQIVDTRVNNPHFTAQVSSTDFATTGGSFGAGRASLVNLAAVPVVGNAFDLTSLNVVPSVNLANTAQTFAQYNGATLGTAWIAADIDIEGVPSSVPSGTYTATLTFTAF